MCRTNHTQVDGEGTVMIPEVLHAAFLEDNHVSQSLLCLYEHKI